MSFFLAARALGIPQASGFVSRIDHELKTDMRDRLRRAAGLVAEEARTRTHSRRVRSAISFEVEVASPIDFRAVVGPLRSRAFFAHFLEFGTKGSPGHAATRAFPFLEPARAATEDQVVDLVGVPPSLR